MQALPNKSQEIYLKSRRISARLTSATQADILVASNILPIFGCRITILHLEICHCKRKNNDIYYTRLERLRNRNGRGRQATYFYIMRDEDGSIYSEKRFSTGELALLHLADSLQNIENGSMVLLDEAEMALHPRIQVAIVDQDAFEGTGNNPTFQQLYSENLDCIFGLGFTPEVFLIEQIEGANRLLKDAIRRKFHIELSQIIQDDEYRTRNSQNPLKLAKDRYSVVLNRLSSASGESAEITNNELIRIIVEHVPDSVVMQLLGRVIGH